MLKCKFRKYDFETFSVLIQCILHIQHSQFFNANINAVPTQTTGAL